MCVPQLPAHVWTAVAEFVLDGAILCRGNGVPVFEPWGNERIEAWWWRGASRPHELEGAAMRGVWAAMLRHCVS